MCESTADSRFELTSKRSFALVCFRLKGPNALTQKLEDAVHADREFFISHATFNDVYFLRVSIGSPQTTREHVVKLWQTIQAKATSILAEK